MDTVFLVLGWLGFLAGGLGVGDGVVVVEFGECECLVGGAELGHWCFGGGWGGDGVWICVLGELTCGLSLGM